MTYAELQTKMIDQSHRKDMANRIPGFINDARGRLNYRLSLELLPLSAPTDTNEILTSNPLLYFYPAMQALYEFILEFETATYYQQQYEEQCSLYYLTRAGTEPLVVTPEEPAP